MPMLQMLHLAGDLDTGAEDGNRADIPSGPDGSVDALAVLASYSKATDGS